MSSTQDSSAAYQAPLHGGDNPHRIPDNYMVHLKSGYTLEQHKRHINLDASSAETIRVIILSKIVDFARLNAEVLAVVRGDPGVELVECNMYIYLPDCEPSDSKLVECDADLEYLDLEYDV